MPAIFVNLKPRVASKPYAQMAPFLIPMLLSPGIRSKRLLPRPNPRHRHRLHRRTRPAGKIEEIGSSAMGMGRKLPGVHVDGSGKFLIPGLWDMHVHMLFGNWFPRGKEITLPLFIANGVTGVRDMGGDLAQLDRWRSEIDSGLRVGPRIIRAGPFVDGPKEGVTNRLTVRTPEEARRAVHDLKAKGVDFIKVHNALPPEAFFALMDEAHKEHIPVAVHLPKNVSSAEASDAGVASLEHVETLYENTLWRKGATAKTIEQGVDEILGPIGQDLFQRFVKNGTWFVPTLVAYERGFVLWSNDPPFRRRAVDQSFSADILLKPSPR